MPRSSTILSEIDASEKLYNIQTSTKNALIYGPAIVMFLCILFFVIPQTRQATLWMLDENHPVEMLTFLFAILGGLFGVALAFRSKRQGENALVYGFYILFSIGLILVGMEEIGWGQQFFGFATPSRMKSINEQGEMTLHNIKGFQSHNGLLRLAFGIGGLIGIWLSFYPYFKKIAVPANLLPCFIVITLHAIVDNYDSFFGPVKHFSYLIDCTSEVNELLISFAGFLYIWLNSRALSFNAQQKPFEKALIPNDINSHLPKRTELRLKHR